MSGKALGRDGKLYPTQRANVADRNRKIIAMWRHGWTATELAEVFDVSMGTVYGAIPAELR